MLPYAFILANMDKLDWKRLPIFIYLLSYRTVLVTLIATDMFMHPLFLSEYSIPLFVIGSLESKAKEEVVVVLG